MFKIKSKNKKHSKIQNNYNVENCKKLCNKCYENEYEIVFENNFLITQCNKCTKCCLNNQYKKYKNIAVNCNEHKINIQYLFCVCYYVLSEYFPYEIIMMILENINSISGFSNIIIKKNKSM